MDAVLAAAGTIAHPRAAHRDRTDAGHNLALWQITVADQSLTTVVGALVGMATQEGSDALASLIHHLTVAFGG